MGAGCGMMRLAKILMFAGDRLCVAVLALLAVGIVNVARAQPIENASVRVQIAVQQYMPE